MAVPEIRDRLLFPKENQTEEEPKLENNHQEAPLPPEQECPRCQSRNTKFCYFNNRCILQPRHYCKDCKRHWTLGGILRDVPLRGKRRNRKPYEVPTSANISCNQQEKTPCQQINSPTGFTAALSSASLRNDGASSSLIPMATTSAKNFPRSGILFPCQALQPLGHPINCEGNDFSLLQGSDVPVFSVQQPQQRHQRNQGFHLPVFTLHQPQQHHQIFQSSLVQSLHQMQNGEGNAFSLLQGSTQPFQPFHNLRQPHQRLQLNQNDSTLVCPLPIVHPLHQPIDGQVSGFSLLQGPSQPVLPFHQHSQHPQGDWPLMCPLPAVQPLHPGSNRELNGFRPSQRPSESVHLLQQHRCTNAGSTGLGPF